MKNLIILTTAILALTACSQQQTVPPENAAQIEYYQCRLEILCSRSEDSIIKKGAFVAIETYFGTDLDDGLCKQHYQAWGLDYRKPAQERCGKQGDFQ